MLREPHDGAVVREAVPSAADVDERAARRDLRAQIAGLERRIAACVRLGAPVVAGEARRRAPRLLDAGALEALRDDLAERLRRAREDLERQEAVREHHRRRLEDMLACPRAHPWERVARRDVGEPGCGVWQVRPRLGIVGMLAGWWHVTLSSGCPLATAATIPPWDDAAASAAAPTWRRRSFPLGRRPSARRPR